MHSFGTTLLIVVIALASFIAPDTAQGCPGCRLEAPIRQTPQERHAHRHLSTVREHHDQALTQLENKLNALEKEGGCDTRGADYALPEFLRLLEETAQYQNPLLNAFAWYRLGVFAETGGAFQMALKLYETGHRALLAPQADGPADDRAQLPPELGVKLFTWASSSPTGAEPYRPPLDEVLKLLSRPRSTEHFAAVLLNASGNMYLLQRQLPGAEKSYHAALKQLTPERTPELRGGLRVNLAWVALESDHPEKALALIEDTIDLAFNILGPGRLQVAYLAAGVAERTLGNLSNAVRLLQLAIDLNAEGDPTDATASAQIQLAATFLELNRTVEAQQLFEQVEASPTAMDRLQIAWQVNLGLARCHKKSGRLEESLKYYKAYLSTLDRLAQAFKTDEGRFSVLEGHRSVLDEIAAVALDSCDPNEDCATTLTLLERLRRRSLDALMTTRLERLEATPGEWTDGALADLLLTQTWPTERRIEESPAAATGPEANEPQEPDFGTLGEQRRDTPWQNMDGIDLLPNQPDNNTGSPPTTRLWDDDLSAPAQTRPNLFLEYFLLPDTGMVFTRSPDGGVHAARVAAGGDAIADLVAQLRLALGVKRLKRVVHAPGLETSETEHTGEAKTDVPRGTYEVVDQDTENLPEADELLRRLYQLLVKPVESLLHESDATLVLVPHRALWLLPFGALIDDKGEALNDRYPLTRAISLESWDWLRRRPRESDHTRGRVYVMGNPGTEVQVACGRRYRWSNLAAAEEEALAIQARFGPERVDLFVGGQADPLRLDAWHAQYGVLHFATHGTTCPEDPLASFLLMADTAGAPWRFDASGCVLRREDDPRLDVHVVGGQNCTPALPALESTRPHSVRLPRDVQLDARTVLDRFTLKADLVTLSACDTGLGQVSDEGIIGLTRAFLGAGARSLLVSLWPVDDRATRELMDTFYAGYLEHGDKARALQNAMMKTRQDHPNPKDWAPFILIGPAE